MKKLRFNLLVIPIAALLVAGCVMPKDFKAQTQRIDNLQLEVQDLKDSMKVRQMEMDRLLGQTRGSLPEMRLEMDNMRTELQRLTNAIEVTEKRGVLPGGETLTLKNQIDYIGARLDRLEARLRLSPLSYKVIEDAAVEEAAEEAGPNIEVREGEPDADEIGYGEAKDLFKNKDYPGALDKFRTFLTEFPESKYAASAQFYVGECLYNQQQYEEAILEYQKVIKEYPKSSKVPTSLLKQGFSFLAIGDNTSAKLLLQKVVRNHRKSYAAGIAREKLKTIK